MANSYVELTANGSATSFSFSFSYIDSSDIALYVDGVVTAFTFTSSNTLSVTTAPTSGAIVRIERTTDSATRLVDFSDGSILTEADLDSSAQQVFNLSQEAVDKTEESVYKTPDGKMDAQSRVIKNVADGVADGDAVNKGQLNIEYPDIQTVAGKATEIGRLGTTSAIADMTTLGASAMVTDMGVLADLQDGTTATNALKTLAEVQDGTVATSALKILAELEDGTVGTNVLTDLAEIRLKISAVGGIDDKIEGLYDNLYTHIYSLGSGTVPNDISAVSSRLADITQLAHIEDGTVATNAIQDVATIKTDVTTVAGVSADVTTVATTVAPSITTLLSDIDDFLDRYIGALGSPPTVFHAAGTMYFDTTASEMRVGDGSGTGASQWHTMNPSAANQTNIDTVATNILDVQQVAADTTHINDLAVISGYLNTIGINLQAVIQTGSLSNMADINLLADIEDGTVVTKGMSTLAATTTDIDRIFLYAIKDEMGRILSGLPPTDSYLSAWLQANHTDGYARVDFNADGTIDVLNDLQLHIKYTGDIATAAEIATWTARIGTPALSDSTLYSKYLDPNTVIPPFWAVWLNKDAINTVATSINSYGLPVSLFSINGNGIVPAPTQAEINGGYLLCANGTWVAP